MLKHFPSFFKNQMHRVKESLKVDTVQCAESRIHIFKNNHSCKIPLKSQKALLIWYYVKGQSIFCSLLDRLVLLLLHLSKFEISGKIISVYHRLSSYLLCYLQLNSCLRILLWQQQTWDCYAHNGVRVFMMSRVSNQISGTFYRNIFFCFNFYHRFL